MSEPFFPFTLKCRDRGGYVQSPTEFRHVFFEARPKDASYYAYDVIVKSPRHIEFVVFGMHCPVRGGLGRETYRVDVDNLDPETSKSALSSRAKELARKRRKQELDDIEAGIIQRYSKEILEGAV